MKKYGSASVVLGAIVKLVMVVRGIDAPLVLVVVVVLSFTAAVVVELNSVALLSTLVSLPSNSNVGIVVTDDVVSLALSINVAVDVLVQVIIVVNVDVFVAVCVNVVVFVDVAVVVTVCVVVEVGLTTQGRGSRVVVIVDVMLVTGGITTTAVVKVLLESSPHTVSLVPFVRTVMYLVQLTLECV